ncbi:MAG: PEGA domain-containing protein [Chloroflexi bacterium]|nr:PEGA domain-containing protein [Chloroflexota bacterium]
MLGACGADTQPGGGVLFVTSAPPGANVLVNGEPRGHTPLTVRDLEPGEHEIVLHSEGYEDTQIIVTVRARQTVNATATLRVARRPSGHRLAFFSNRDGAYDLWTVNETGRDPLRWSSHRWVRSPLMVAAAPGGGVIAVNVEEAGGLKTWLISGPRPDLPPNAEPELRALGGDVFRILQWSSDGRSLLMKNMVSQTIWISAPTGTVTQLRIPEAPRGVLTAAFVPDGNSIAYADYENTYLLSLDGLKRQPVAPNGREGNTYLRFSRDGRQLVFASMQKPNAYNAGELFLAEPNGGDPQKLTLAGSQDFDPIWTADGRRIIYVHRENVQQSAADLDPSLLVSNLWVIDLQARTQRPLTAFAGKRVRQPSISTDDQRVTFVCNCSGRDDIWVADFFGGDPYALTQDDAIDSFPMWLW